MDGHQSVETDSRVDFLDHRFVPIRGGQVISGGIGVTGIHADPDPGVSPRAVDYVSQVSESISHVSALAGGTFENRTGRRGPLEDRPDALGNCGDGVLF